jgi:hypothetical protein
VIFHNALPDLRTSDRDRVKYSTDRRPKEYEQSGNGQRRGESERLILCDHDRPFGPVSQQQVPDDCLPITDRTGFPADAAPQLHAFIGDLNLIVAPLAKFSRFETRKMRRRIVTEPGPVGDRQAIVGYLSLA